MLARECLAVETSTGMLWHIKHRVAHCTELYNRLHTPAHALSITAWVVTASHISKVSTMVEQPLRAPQRKTAAYVAGQTPEGRIQGTHVFHRDLLRVAKVNVPDGHTTVT